MARLFVAIGGLIVLALTAALVAPYFVDWTSYRADFEREAGRILGRQVTVRGEATARLLPFPSVTFTDVAVAGIAPGKPAMTVETFSMDAELAPFLRGDVHIFDMRLVRPRVLVDVAGDGSLDWAVRPSVPVEASHISLEKLTVTDGRIDLRHAASGRTHHVTEIDAGISARALTGPWRMDGSLRLDGMRMALTASTGQVDAAGGMRLRLNAQPQLYPFALEADGNARIEDGRARYAGTFRLNAPVAAEPAVAGTRPQPPLVRLSGGFDLDHTTLSVPEFRFETGAAEDPYTAEGSASFDLGAEPRFLVQADGAQFRLDGGGDETAGRFGLRERLAVLHQFLRDMPRPSIPGRVEMALPALVAGDTTLRDLHLVAEPSDAGWMVASAGATLPGRTTVEASGELGTGEELGFEGSLLVAVGQPSGFAAWLARDVDDAVRRLPAAGFSARVSLKPERQSFGDLELVLGPAKFGGEIDSRTPAQGRATISLRLDGDRLDIDDMAAFTSLFVSDSGEARMSDSDLEFEITAGPVSAGGLTAETLDTALRLKEGRLEIDRLAIGGFAGANISATGTLRDLAGTPSGNLDVSVIAADLAPLAAALAGHFPDDRFVAGAWRRAQAYPGLYEDASLRVVALLGDESGEAGTLSLDAAGEAGGTAVALTARLRDALSLSPDAPLDFVLSANSREASALYALLGLPALPLDFAGAAQTRLSFDGVPANAGKTTFSFTGRGLSFTFDGEAGWKETDLTANGAGVLEADDLDPWLATAGVSLPGMGLGLPAGLQAGVDVGDGLLVLSGLNGTVVDSAISGDINARLRDGLPHLTGALSLAAFDLAPVAELLTGAPALAVEEGGWPDAPFVTSPAPPLTAELDLAIDRLAAGTFADARDARLTLRLDRDGVSLADVHAAMSGGDVSGFVDFRNNGGTGLLSAQISLHGVDARQIPGDVGLAGKGDLTASVTASGKSINGVVSSLAGSGRAGFEQISISGLAPRAFAALLAKADEHGPDIDAADVAGFAPALVRDGVFAAEGVEAAFTITNGVMRAPPLRLETQGAALAGEVRADLAARTVGADVTLTYEAGEEALAGSEPSVRLAAAGPPGAVRVEMDMQPLTQFLTQRALELEQQRVEAMQAALIEKQRLRREVRYYAALAAGREAAAGEARRAAEEAERLERERLLLEQEAQRRQEEEEARRRAAEEDARAQEEARKRKAEEEAAKAEAERRRLEDERLRAQVEELLRARAAVPVAPGQPAANITVPAPPALPVAPEVTPMPAPRNEPVAPAEIAPPQPSAHTVAPQGGLSLDSLLRAIGAGQ